MYTDALWSIGYKMHYWLLDEEYKKEEELLVKYSLKNKINLNENNGAGLFGVKSGRLSEYFERLVFVKSALCPVSDITISVT